MPVYQVHLARSFIIEVEAKSANHAARFSELFLGYLDESKENDGKKFKFKIKDIEMTVNDAMEVQVFQKT